MSEVYNHKVVEKKWQKVWDDEKAFAATNDYQYFSISFTNNDSELSVIDSGTMIAVTSKKWLDGCEWITDNNWDDLAANCIEYD